MPDVLDNPWNVTTDPCPCVCPPDPPIVTVWVRIKFGDADFTDWLEGIGPGLTSPDDRVQVQWRYTGGGTDTWRIQVREVSIDKSATPFTYGTPGGTTELIGVGGTFLVGGDGDDFIEISAVTTDEEKWLVGPPGRADVSSATGDIQEASAEKFGFPAYAGEGTVSAYYRTETASGSYPGGEDGSAARTYSGEHHYTGATYSSTLSADLIRMGYASRPGTGSIYRITKTFGTVTETATVHTMVRAYVDDDGADREETLTLTLSDEYSTSELLSTVDTDLSSQVGGSTGIGLPVLPVVSASHFLSPGETIHERRESQLTLLPGVTGVYLPEGGSITVVVRWKKRVYDRRSGGTVSESSASHSFGYSANDDTFAVPDGRALDYPAGFLIDDVADDNTRIELVDFECDPIDELSSGFVPERVDP